MNSFLCSLLKKGVSSWSVSDDPPKVQGIYYVAAARSAFYSVYSLPFCNGALSPHQSLGSALWHGGKDGIVQLPNGPFLFRCI